MSRLQRRLATAERVPSAFAKYYWLHVPCHVRTSHACFHVRLLLISRHPSLLPSHFLQHVRLLLLILQLLLLLGGIQHQGFLKTNEHA